MFVIYFSRARIQRLECVDFNLEASVGRGKDMQDIGAHGELEKRVFTLLVMRGFSDLPGVLRACVDFRDPTDVSRFNQGQRAMDGYSLVREYN